MRTRTITGHDDWLRQSRARMGFKRQRSVRDRDVDAGDRDLDAGDTMLHATRQVTRRLEGGARVPLYIRRCKGTLVALMLNNRAQVVASRVLASYDIWPWRGYQSLATIHSAAFSLLTSLFQVAAIPRVLTSKLINSISIILRSENLRYSRTPS